jgi:hypothetical protein
VRLIVKSRVYAHIYVDNKLIIYESGRSVIERIKFYLYAKLAFPRVATRNLSYEAEKGIRWYAFLHMRI